MPSCEGWFAIGCVFDPEKVFKKFIKKKPQKSHNEARWDPKTGEQVGHEEIIDEEGCDVVVVCGREFKLDDEFFPYGVVCEFVAKKVGGYYAQDEICQDSGDVEYITHAFVIGSRDSLDWIAKNAPRKCEVMIAKLRKLGIVVGKPKILVGAHEC